MGLLGIGKWAELQAWGRRQKLEDNWNLTTWPVYTCRSDCTCWNIAFRSRCQPQMDPLVATPEKMEKVVWTSAALKSSSWARCETFKGSHSQLHPRFALPGQMFKWFSSKNQQKNIYIEYIYFTCSNISKNMQKSRLFMYFERFSFRKNTKLRCFDVSSPGQWSDLAFTMAMLFPLALWILKLPRTPPAADPAGKLTKKQQTQLHDFPFLLLDS